MVRSSLWETERLRGPRLPDRFVEIAMHLVVLNLDGYWRLPSLGRVGSVRRAAGGNFDNSFPAMSSPPSGAVSPANIELEDQPVRLEAGLAGPEKDLHAGGELPAGGDDSPESDLSTAADESAPENGETPTDEEIGQVVSKLSGLEAYNETIKNLEPPPDGGWEAWLVVAAGVFTCALGGGSDWAFGVFQRYYTQSGVFPGADNKTIALIGSVSGGLFGIVGLFAGRLTDTWGPRKVIMVGAVCYVLGYLLASFSTEVWQLFLTQGVLKGIGGGFQYMGPLSVLPQWFSKKRGLGQFAVCVSLSPVRRNFVSWTNTSSPLRYSDGNNGLGSWIGRVRICILDASHARSFWAPMDPPNLGFHRRRSLLLHHFRCQDSIPPFERRTFVGPQQAQIKTVLDRRRSAVLDPDGLLHPHILHPELLHDRFGNPRK